MKTKKIMNSIKTHIIYLVIIAALVAILGLAFSRPQKVVTETKYVTDTTVVERIDTMVITKIKEVEKTVTDTAYIVVRDSIFVPIPMSDYRFSQKGLYDITAHGYNVSLSNVTVYPKTVTNTVTNTIEKEVVVKSWDFYIGAGFFALNKEVIPDVSLAVKSPNKWLFSLSTGYYNKGWFYGGTAYYKIGNK